MTTIDPTPHQTLASFARNKSTWGQALEFAASPQEWNKDGLGNPFHTLLEHANPELLDETLYYKSLSNPLNEDMPLFLRYSSLAKSGMVPSVIEDLDANWITQHRPVDGATPLHRVFTDIVQKARWFKPQDGRMNGHLVQFAEHADALSRAWKLAALFNRRGGDFMQEDHQGVCLAQLIIEADHSLSPEYRVSKERESLRKLEAFWQAALLDRTTTQSTHTRPIDRL